LESALLLQLQRAAPVSFDPEAQERLPALLPEHPRRCVSHILVAPPRLLATSSRPAMVSRNSGAPRHNQEQHVVVRRGTNFLGFARLGFFVKFCQFDLFEIKGINMWMWYCEFENRV
jgi:hypothetical protein